MTATVTATATATATVPGPVDVVCLGESMVTFLPTEPGRLADVPSFVRGIGGAESNVACGLAAAGHRAQWVGRVGADGFGEYLVAAIASYGVDTSAVQRDPHRPTGIYFRTATDRASDAHEVLYYRAGSAASAMSPRTVPYEDLAGARILHLSGITAALSDDCLAMMRELTARRPGPRPLVSFDVNHRPGLWRDDTGARVLLELARGADIVFVGEDEAEAAWGLKGPEAIRVALPEPEVLVVKQGATGATVFGPGAGRCAGHLPTPPLPEPGALAPGPGSLSAGGAGCCAPGVLAPGPGSLSAGGAGCGAPGTLPPGPGGAGCVTFVPALRVDVVAPVGAGDAFAAGFLSATLRGLPAQDRLRHGHLMAAATLTVAGDLAAPPARAYADRLAALDARAWGRLRLGPGWTAVTAQGAQGAQDPQHSKHSQDPQEVRTA